MLSDKNLAPVISAVLLALTLVWCAGYWYRTRSLSVDTPATGADHFAQFKTSQQKLPSQTRDLTLLLVGDISYSRGVERAVKNRNDWQYPFAQVQGYLNTADLVYANLETPIVAGEPIPDFNMLFRSDPGTERALKTAGISVVSLANNHTMNFGALGLAATLENLDAVGIKHVGAGLTRVQAEEPAIIEKNNVRVAFLSYTDPSFVPTGYEVGVSHPGVMFMRTAQMESAVRSARNQADLVIVAMHSGTEYASAPNKYQVSFAHAAVDAGADLVVGNHPHVVQTMEQYRGRLIFYSMGNFVFDQPFSEETRQGLMVKMYVSEGEVTRAELVPVYQEQFARPQIVRGKIRDNVLTRLRYEYSKRPLYIFNNKLGKYEEDFLAEVTLKPPVRTTRSKTIRHDVDADGKNEWISLKGGILAVTHDSATGTVLWESPIDWWVSDFAVGDSTNDGVLDLVLSVWKAGNFGSSKPTWVGTNDMSVKNHLYVYKYKDNGFVQEWGSSNLEGPNCAIALADTDGDKKSELVVIEGTYTDDFMCVGQYIAVWKWNGWGFANEWRGEANETTNLGIIPLPEGAAFNAYDR